MSSDSAFAVDFTGLSKSDCEMPEDTIPRIIVSCNIIVMGVSGCGKSTIGRALAEQSRCPFVEGDTLHSPANIAKMMAGIALADEDRWPFLERVAQVIAAANSSGIVVSCSALKRSYRDFIRARAGNVIFVLPVIDREALYRRLSHRLDHFMPLALLDSQLATLETPAAEEAAILIDGMAATREQVTRVKDALETRVI